MGTETAPCPNLAASRRLYPARDAMNAFDTLGVIVVIVLIVLWLSLRD
jgi:hypothetical protein